MSNNICWAPDMHKASFHSYVILLIDCVDQSSLEILVYF